MNHDFSKAKTSMSLAESGLILARKQLNILEETNDDMVKRDACSILTKAIELVLHHVERIDVEKTKILCELYKNSK